MGHLFFAMISLLFSFYSFGQYTRLAADQDTVPYVEISSEFADESTGEYVKNLGRGFWVLTKYRGSISLQLLTAGHVVGGRNKEVFVGSSGETFCSEPLDCPLSTDNMRDLAMFSVPLPDLGLDLDHAQYAEYYFEAYREYLATIIKPVFTLDFDNPEDSQIKMDMGGRYSAIARHNWKRRGTIVLTGFYPLFLSASQQELEVLDRYEPGMSGTPTLTPEGLLQGMVISASKFFWRSWQIPAEEIRTAILNTVSGINDENPDGLQWALNDGRLYRRGSIPDELRIAGLEPDTTNTQVPYFVEANGPRQTAGLFDRNNTGGRSDVSRGDPIGGRSDIGNGAEDDGFGDSVAQLGGQDIVAMHVDCRDEGGQRQDFFVPATMELFYFDKSFREFEEDHNLDCTRQRIADANALFTAWRDSLLRYRGSDQTNYALVRGEYPIYLTEDEDPQDQYDLSIEVPHAGAVIVHVKSPNRPFKNGMDFEINADNILDPYIEVAFDKEYPDPNSSMYIVGGDARLEHQQLVFATANLNKPLNGLGREGINGTISFNVQLDGSGEGRSVLFVEYDRWAPSLDEPRAVPAAPASAQIIDQSQVPSAPNRASLLRNGGIFDGRRGLFRRR